MPGRSRLPYRPGSVFIVPIGAEQFARGVVARAAPRGRIVLGYFFGPVLSHPVGRCDDLGAGNAVAVNRFGDLHLMDGR